MQNNVIWNNTSILKENRAKQKEQKPCILWFTGLSGSGKSTIANALEVKLHNLGYHTYILDGDNVRYGLNKDLGFDDSSRVENIRRVGEVSKLFVDCGIIVLTAFISPFSKDREFVRSLVNKDEFIEIFLDTTLQICEQRDPKGLYKKARRGEIKDFTGINSPYEIPRNCEIVIDNGNVTIDENVSIILDYLVEKKYIKQNK